MITNMFLTSFPFLLCFFSMAAPHVAGAVAMYLELNPTWRRSDIMNAFHSDGIWNAISDAGEASPNLLLNTGSIGRTYETEEEEEPVCSPRYGTCETSADCCEKQRCFHWRVMRGFSFCY